VGRGEKPVHHHRKKGSRLIPQERERTKKWGGPNHIFERGQKKGTGSEKTKMGRDTQAKNSISSTTSWGNYRKYEKEGERRNTQWEWGGTKRAVRTSGTLPPKMESEKGINSAPTMRKT